MTHNYQTGETYDRVEDIHLVHGGQRYGGMSTPRGSDLIFLFTGSQGAKHRYEDRPQPDGLFWYYGEGQRGDMTLSRANMASRIMKPTDESSSCSSTSAAEPCGSLANAPVLAFATKTRPTATETCAKQSSSSSSSHPREMRRVSHGPNRSPTKEPRYWTISIDSLAKLANRSSAPVNEDERRTMVRRPFASWRSGGPMVFASDAGRMPRFSTDIDAHSSRFTTCTECPTAVLIGQKMSSRYVPTATAAYTTARTAWTTTGR